MSVHDGKPFNLSHRTHRQLIGYLGILLPLILVGLNGLRLTPGLPQWHTLDSVSAYYYSGAVAAFVGILFALSLFLLTYGDSGEYLPDRVIGGIGGVCALGVAFFPTGAPDGLQNPAWWTPTTRTIHYVSAVCLFLVFILFALWLFRKTNVPKGEELPPGKQWRNRIYLVCGVVMIASMAWAGSSFFTGAPIFWAETFALWAFAVSWLVKGDAQRPVVAVAKAWMDRAQKSPGA